MNKRLWIFLAAAFRAAVGLAQLAAANDTEEVTIISTNVIEKAWKRDVVMVTKDGEFVNDSGTVGSYAETLAIQQAAAEAQQISTAANTAMTNALTQLYAVTNTMARNAQGFALAFLPEGNRETLTMAVIDETTDGTNDTQYVYINQTLGLKPRRKVVYEYYGGSVTQECKWTSWTSNGVTRVVNGQTWQGVHPCTITRPTFARGVTCLTMPNDKIGSGTGMEFGDMLLTLGGGTTNTYTGVITNATAGKVAYFNNGFLMSIENTGAAE